MGFAGELYIPSLKWVANNFKGDPCYSKATAKPFVEKNNKSVEALNVYLTSFRDEIQDLIMDDYTTVSVDSKLHIFLLRNMPGSRLLTYFCNFKLEFVQLSVKLNYKPFFTIFTFCLCDGKRLRSTSSCTRL